MIEIHLDAIATSVNFVGAVFLAIDALRARRRTKVKRGGAKLIKGLTEADAPPKVQSLGRDAYSEQTPDPNMHVEAGEIQSADGHVLDSIDALEDWADRLTAERARIGFLLLVVGFGLDLLSKVFSNPLLFSI
jgi:hypothetical protein